MNKIHKKRKFIIPFVSVLLLCSTVVPALASPNSYGSGYYGECPYSSNTSNCDISISNSAFTLNLNITPSLSTSCTIQSDQVSVSTYDPNGYTLNVSDESANNNLLNDNGSGSDVPATSATLSSPQTLINDWGFREDGWQSFGSGPTSSETNGASSSLLFAKIPPTGTNYELATTSSGNNNSPLSTTVWYGICANNNLTIPNGYYASTLIYTATAN
ncbi:MAG TPA: hypothetical protein VMR34_01210 [Candidatus Saccharimonadales bacterium]|nr:hypothetical protein [Candidatus Saccharimonadales bacterium]